VEDRLQQLANRQRVPLNVLFSSDHAITTLGFCSEGLGLAVLPSFIAEKVKGFGLKSKPIHDETLVYNVVACLKEDSLVSEPARRLMTFLKS
jgi:DNA-binding transcriptional LysR family regulator